MTCVGGGDKMSTNGSVSVSDVVVCEALSSSRSSWPLDVCNEVDEVMASGLMPKDEPGRARPFGRGGGSEWVRRGGGERVWLVDGVCTSLFGSACSGSETDTVSAQVSANGLSCCGGLDGADLGSSSGACGGCRGSHQCRTHCGGWLDGLCGLE